MYFHEEEHLFDYLSDDKGSDYSPVVMEFAEGDSYVCEFETSYESCTLEYDMDDPRYEDFWESWYRVAKIIKEGPNANIGYEEDGSLDGAILVNYKHFPVRVTTPDGTVLYEK